jgi:hypothetical protein
MELREFVATTLKQIIDGIQDAQEYVEKSGSTAEIVNQFPIGCCKTKIEFDVAVTAGSSTTAEGKAGISVFSIGATTGAQMERLSSTVSRIRFPVPVDLPQQGLKRQKG